MTTPPQGQLNIGARIAENVIGGLQQSHERSAMSQILKEVQREQDPVTKQNKINDVLLRVSPENREMAAYMFAKQDEVAKQQRGRQGMIKEGINPDLPEKERLALIKRGTKQKNTEQGVQGVVDDMSTMIVKDMSGIGISPTTAAAGFLNLGGAGLQNRAHFNSLRSGIEAALLPMVNKGPLTRVRFDFIMGLIPKGDENQSIMAGKLYGLATALKEEGLNVNTDILDSSKFRSQLKGDKQQTPTQPAAKQTPGQILNSIW